MILCGDTFQGNVVTDIPSFSGVKALPGNEAGSRLSGGQAVCGLSSQPISLLELGKEVGAEEEGSACGRPPMLLLTLPSPCP